MNWQFKKLENVDFTWAGITQSV